MSDKESIGQTLLVAGTVALVCSLIVSVAVAWLRPIQLAYRAVEENRSVLVAAGLVAGTATVADSEIVDRFLELEPRLVDLDSGRYISADVSMIAAYDYRAAADDPESSREVTASLDLASISRRPLAMPVYLLHRNGALDRIVLPIYGRGMWSTIHVYLVLDGSLTRVVNAQIAEHGETPGIGDRIENPDWLARWPGKRALRDDGTVALRVGRSGDAPPDERIDGITGATVTVEALDRIVSYWLGADGYGPFLEWLRQEG
jgi:Na+-transporting NADH:ubiquinone oxidoreductase subunit C